PDADERVRLPLVADRGRQRVAGVDAGCVVERHQPLHHRMLDVAEAVRPAARGAAERSLEQHVGGEDVRAIDLQRDVIVAVPGRVQGTDPQIARRQLAAIAQVGPAQQWHVEPPGHVLDADHVIAVAVRDELVGDGDPVALDPVEQWSRLAVSVDQDALTAGAVGHEVGVRRPLGMLAAGDDHVNPITLRIPSWASISSKPRLTSSSVMLCERKGSTSISPASQRSISCGTPSRPLTPPNELPATRRPVISRRGTMSSVSSLPATPATVHRPQPMRADSTAWRITATLPVASNV